MSSGEDFEEIIFLPSGLELLGIDAALYMVLWNHGLWSDRGIGI